MSATKDLIELVAARLGDPVYNRPSYRRMADFLGLSSAQLHRLGSDMEVMSPETFAKVAKALALPMRDCSYFSLQLTAERERDEAVREFFMARAREFDTELRSFAKTTGQAIKNSKTARAVKASTVLGATAIVALLGASPSPARAGTYDGAREAPHTGQSIHYAKYRRRRISRRKPHFPVVAGTGPRRMALNLG